MCLAIQNPWVWEPFKIHYQPKEHCISFWGMGDRATSQRARHSCSLRHPGMVGGNEAPSLPAFGRWPFLPFVPKKAHSCSFLCSNEFEVSPVGQDDISLADMYRWKVSAYAPCSSTCTSGRFGFRVSWPFTKRFPGMPAAARSWFYLKAF